MDNKEQYIEPLIKVIEQNEDKSWLRYFLDLRVGGYLPGGGAGSLNDWSPSYLNEIKHSWYSNLYKILRHLYDNNLQANHINEIREVKLSNYIQVIRCLICNKSYQHPSVFESHIALNYFYKNFIELAEKKLLLNLFIPELTYENQESIDYRSWLIKQYETNNIKIYDFVSNKYICPHCCKEHGKTEQDNYFIKNEGIEKMEFQKVNLNTNWEKVEKTQIANNTISISIKMWWQKFLSIK
jgi:hypothetical protein